MNRHGTRFNVSRDCTNIKLAFVYTLNMCYVAWDGMHFVRHWNV